jgi:hypothetical protein
VRRMATHFGDSLFETMQWTPKVLKSYTPKIGPIS